MIQSKIFQLYSKLIRNNRRSFATGSSGRDSSSTNVSYISTVPSKTSVVGYGLLANLADYVYDTVKIEKRENVQLKNSVGFQKVSIFKPQQRFYRSSIEMKIIDRFTKDAQNNRKKIEELMDTVMKQSVDLTLLKGHLKAATTELLSIPGTLLPRSLIELFEDEYTVEKVSIKDLSSKESVFGYGYGCWKISIYKSQRRFYCSSTEMEVINKLTNTIVANAKTIDEKDKIIQNNQKKIDELTDTVMKQTVDLTLLRIQLKAATTDLLFIQGKLLPRSLIELFEDEYMVRELDRHLMALGLNVRKAIDPTDPLMNYKRMERFEKWSYFLKIKEDCIVQQLQNVAVENIPYVIMQLYERLSSSVHRTATVWPSGIRINSQHFTSEELQILVIIGEASPVSYRII